MWNSLGVCKIAFLRGDRDTVGYQAVHSFLSHNMSLGITQFQLLAVVVGPSLVTLLTYYYLVRKIESFRSGSAPLEFSDTASFVKSALLVVVLAVCLVYMPQDVSPRDLIVRMGFLSTVEERPLAVWQRSAGGTGRFQWRAFDMDNETRYPVIECAAFENASALQDELLGKLADAHPGDALDPIIQRERLDRQREEARLRDHARHRCVLNPPSELVALDLRFLPARMEHLVADNAPSLVDVVRASKAHLPFLPVEDILLARDGTRYYRVNVAEKNGTVTRVQSRVVSEEQLLEGPREWYRYFCANPAFSVFPCLCPAHLGYVKSNFYFHYPPDYETSAGECDRPWRLWTKARLIRPLQGANFVYSHMVYQPFPDAFPLRVNQKLNITGLEHADMTQVEYMDVARVFSSARGLGLLSLHEPEWVADVTINPSEVSPLLAVLPFGALIGSEGLEARVLEGDTNACFNYCLYLDEVLLR